MASFGVIIMAHCRSTIHFNFAELCRVYSFIKNHTITICSPVFLLDRHDNEWKKTKLYPPPPPPPHPPTTPPPKKKKKKKNPHPQPTPPPPHTASRHSTSCQYTPRKISYYKNILLVYIYNNTWSESFWHRAETMAIFFLSYTYKSIVFWLTEWTFHVMLSHIPATVGASVWREPRGHGPYIDVLIMVRGWNVGHTLDTISFQTESDTLSCSNYYMQKWIPFLKCVMNMLYFVIPKNLTGKGHAII